MRKKATKQKSPPVLLSVKDVRPTEEQLQIYSKQRLDLLRDAGRMTPGIVYFHVPNGEYRDPHTAGKLKEMGLLPGVPDWVFIVPTDHAIPEARFLELKKHNGKLSTSQERFRDDIFLMGGKYVVAKSCEDIERAFEHLGVVRQECLA